MGKASKARKRKGRRQDGLKANAMDEDKPRKNGETTATKDGEEGDGNTSSHSVFKRHAAERKAVKHEIALLKLRRKKLRKKFPKEAAEKREINKKIKALIKDITEKQQKELKELGIVKGTQTNEFAEEDVDMDS